MKPKRQVLNFANQVTRSGFHFSQRLPSFYCGHWLWLPRQTWTSLYLQYEYHMARAITDHLAPRGVFWDIGANIGLFSLLAARIVGPAGSVVAFEPSPDVFALLRENASRDRTIQCLPYGVGNAEGMMSFAAQGTSSSSSFIPEVTELNLRNNPGQAIHQVDVRMRKLDMLLGELRAPSVVKIDVEGFELEVLKGAERLLSEVRPILLMEIHPPQLHLSGGDEKMLFSLLESYRYAWRIIDRNPNSLYSVVAQSQAADRPGCVRPIG